MTSGVLVNDAARAAIDDMKIHLQKDDPRSRNKFLFFKVDQVKGEIAVHEAVTMTDLIKYKEKDNLDTYGVFRKKLQEYTACYALWDCCYETDLTEKSELVSLMWISEECGVKERMLYATSKNSLKKALSACGIKHEWELNDKCEVNDLKCLCKRFPGQILKLEGCDLNDHHDLHDLRDHRDRDQRDLRDHRDHHDHHDHPNHHDH